MGKQLSHAKAEETLRRTEDAAQWLKQNNAHWRLLA